MSSRRTSSSVTATRALGWLALLALPLTVESRSAAAADERYSLSGGEVAIHNVAGAVTVEAGTGDQVVVQVKRGGRDAAQLKVETGTHDGRQTLQVLYPGSTVIYPPMGVGSSTTTWITSDGRIRTDGIKAGIGLEMFGGKVGSKRVTVRGMGRGTEAHADLLVLVPPGKETRLYLCAGTAAARNVNGTLKIDGQSVHLSAERTRGTLVLSTGSGSVKAIDVQGQLVLDTGSGGINVSGAKGTTLTLDTGSGNIAGVDLDVDVLNADTGSGSIRLDQVRAARIGLDTGSGDVMIDLSADVASLAVDTGSGDVTVTCPKALGASFDVETGSGDIDIEIPSETSRMERDHIIGRFGDGNGRIQVESGSGSIRFARRHVGGASLGGGAARFFGYPVQ
jgi:hypothetical protein